MHQKPRLPLTLVPRTHKRTFCCIHVYVLCLSGIMTKSGVHFTEPAVTCISRPPNQREDRAIRGFERHAWKYRSCNLSANRNNCEMSYCSRGSCLAENVLKQLQYARGGHATSTVERQPWHVRIEVPFRYEATWDLLYADRPYHRTLRWYPSVRQDHQSRKPTYTSKIGASYFSPPDMPLYLRVDAARVRWSNKTCDFYSIVRRVVHYVW